MSGLRIERRFTIEGQDPFDSVEWSRRDSRITNPDGSIVFEMIDAEIPASWSQVATDIMVSKYFRKAGVPQLDADGSPLLDEDGEPVLGPERSARQTIGRLAETWRWWGEQYGYFATERDAQAFEDELKYMLVNQMAAPNSPQWFNTGLHHAYGITGTPEGFWYVDPDSEEAVPSPDTYSRPAPHACFIQSIDDDLVNPGGIMDLWVREARLFKVGSGCTAGDSRIYVDDRGFAPIRDLYRRFADAGRTVHEFDGKGRFIDIRDADLSTISVDPATGRYRRSHIEMVWQYDVDADDKVTVRFDRGARATVSSWHPFLVWDGDRVVERRADELQRGDAVVGPNQTAVDATLEQEVVAKYQTTYFGKARDHQMRIDADLAWLVGYFLGDGSLGRITNRTRNGYGKQYEYDRLRLRFHDETVPVLERVRDIVARQFDEHASIQEDGRGSNGKHVTYTGRKVTGFFSLFSEPGAKATTLRMPEFVWHGGVDLAMAFLAGLVDSDGTVSEGRATYTTAADDFARDVATLSSLHGLGGGVVANGNVNTVTIVHKATGDAERAPLAKHLTHPDRLRRLMTHDVQHERSFCMPLSESWKRRLFGEAAAPAEWLSMVVGGEPMHLGRLQYEGLINPLKLGRALDLLEPSSDTDFLRRIADSVVFVRSVEACEDDPDFYDLTVADHSNYLAGETGLVAIHNTGTNFSRIRAEGEPLSGGGKSSGLMSFLKVGDRAAGAIKSGGTTRRAAKMVILDLDHPDIEEFVAWKAKEEDKVRALIAAGYPSDFNGEAYQTVSGQNSNNSVRVPDEFMKALAEDGIWELTRRTDGEVVKQIRARELWRQIADAAWRCADPGVQFDTTINAWHTSPAGGRIRASNPCFTGDTRVATDKGLVQFKDLVRRVAEGETFDVYTHDATGEEPTETISLTTPTQVMVTGTNEVLRLEFSDGRVIRATPNHRFFTHNRGYVRADSLEPSDKVRLLDQPIDFGMAGWELPAATAGLEKWTGDFAHYLGWLVGAGWVAEDEAVTVYGADDEQRDAMLRHQSLLSEVGAEVVEMGDGTRQLRVKGGELGELLRALGLSRKLDVPAAVFEAPKPIVAAFLRGLYDADACVSWVGDQHVGLACGSADLVRGVQQLLDVFGVATVISQQAGGRPFAYESADGAKRSHAAQPLHDLRVVPDGMAAFSSSIGFDLPSKGDLLAQLLAETARTSTRHEATLVSRERDGWETTYNLTEPRNHSYLAGGALVSNCSEYLFLDNTACNLASLNLVSFSDGAQFDIEAYRHAVRLWTLVLEISVTMAHFPSKEIAQGSYDYRTLGLGYANLGSLLMRWGIPYDSDEGRAIAGALTAILTGDAYGTSAEMAEALGPFPKFAENREHMLRVIRNHRRAAYNAPDDAYEGVNHRVLGLDPELCPDELVAAARHSWDQALSMGEEHGYRNAQSSVLAPTGTISLLMDCDTTGVEPDFALVKFKKLAGGGYFKIANQSIEPALENLGYTPEQRRDIVDYVVGTMTLAGSPHINKASLTEKGFTADDLERIEAQLAGVFELRHAFNVFVLGEESMERLGIDEDTYTAFDFDMLRALGFTKTQIEEANRVICGMQTIEGAPHLRDEDLAVFDTANRNGSYGQRFIPAMGHVMMMAAAQPWITGSISKTANLPNEATIEEIEELYHASWEWGLKSIALYRDGSKASQPLSASSDEGSEHEDDEIEGLAEAIEIEAQAANGQMVPFVPTPGLSPTQAYHGVPRPRFLLPGRRTGFTQEARIGGHKVFLRTGEYEDGTLGEVFIDLAKEGATLRGVLSCFAIAVSKGLQYGVPLDEFVDTFTFQTFEPRGMVEGHPNIKMANSIVDYVFRALGMEYLERDDLVQVPPQRELPEPPKGLAVDAGVQVTLDEALRETDIDAQRAAADFADAEGGSPASVTGRHTVNLMPQPASAGVAGDPFSGNGNGAAPKVAGDGPGTARAAVTAPVDTMDRALGDLMGDAPFCDTCGHITVRNGSCYRCLNCGDSKGCS